MGRAEGGRRRPEEIAALLAEAQAECRAHAEHAADPRGRQLFDKIAGYLDVAIQALQSYPQEEPRAGASRTLH